MAVVFAQINDEATVQHTGVGESAMRAYRTVIAIGLAVVVCITIFLSLVSVTAPKNAVGPSVMGRQMLVVRSGSMSPTFATGSVVGIKSIDAIAANKIQEGTIVAFRSLANPDILITHRVISRLTPYTKYTVPGTSQYLTKGDANAAEDGTILSASRIVGVYSFAIPRGGYFLVAIQQGRLLAGLIAAFILASVAVMLMQQANRSTQTKENQ